jgi:hypothetical protein
MKPQQRRGRARVFARELLADAISVVPGLSTAE